MNVTSVSGQKVAAPYEVATWQGFKAAAISYTFDDNSQNQLEKVVPLFDTYGFKLTLFTVVDWNPDWKNLQTAANKGHEIASHTMTHPSLDNLSDADQTKEYRESKNIINSNIIGQNCVTIAYPFCTRGKTNLCSEFYIAARGCDGQLESSSPSDFMNISSINCGTEGDVRTANEFNAETEQAIASKSWCVFMMHAIDDVNDFSAVSSEELRNHLNYISANYDRFWVNTFGNVVRYIKERNAVSLIELSVHSKQISLQLTDSLDNSFYNIPLSIRRPLPHGWKKVVVIQGTSTLTSRIKTLNGINYIQFDIVPNAGTIVISKSKTS